MLRQGGIISSKHYSVCNYWIIYFGPAHTIWVDNLYIFATTTVSLLHVADICHFFGQYSSTFFLNTFIVHNHYCTYCSIPEITIFPIPSRNSPPGPICLELLYCVLGLANWRPHVPPSPSSSDLLIIRYKISDIC